MKPPYRPPSDKPPESQKDFPRQIKLKSRRKQKARREGDRSIWYGLGLYGLVGWSIAIPTLIGVAIGLWLDSHSPGQYSWTLSLLLLGVVLGCLNAWYWIERESHHD